MSKSAPTKKMSKETVLGQSAMNQILDKQREHYSESERSKLITKLESSLVRFDKSGKGKLTVDEYYNVLKLQNKVDISKDDIRKMCADLDMDKEYKVAIKDFIDMPIISQAVFDAMDRNRDGYVSKGELKLASKNISMKELSEIIDEIDTDNDGKLNFEEVKAVNKRAHQTVMKAKAKAKKK